MAEQECHRTVHSCEIESDPSLAAIHEGLTPYHALQIDDFLDAIVHGRDPLGVVHVPKRISGSARRAEYLNTVLRRGLDQLLDRDREVRGPRGADIAPGLTEQPLHATGGGDDQEVDGVRRMR